MFLDKYFRIEFLNQSKFFDLFSIMSINTLLFLATFVCSKLTFDDDVLQVDFIHRMGKLEIEIAYLY